MFAEHIDQPIAVDRLGHVVGRAQSKTHFLVVEHGQDDDRYFGNLRVGLQSRQDGPAIHLGHVHIERNQFRFQFLGHPDAFLAVRRNGYAEPFLGQEASHEVMHCRIVVDDQNGAGSRRRFAKARFPGSDCGVRFLHSGRGHDGRQLDGEGGSLAQLAFDRHISAHHLTKVPRDGQTKAAAAVFARC